MDLNDTNFINQNLVASALDEDSSINKCISNAFKHILVTNLNEQDRFQVYSYLANGKFDAAVALIDERYPDISTKLQFQINKDLSKAYAKSD